MILLYLLLLILILLYLLLFILYLLVYLLLYLLSLLEFTRVLQRKGMAFCLYLQIIYIFLTI